MNQSNFDPNSLVPSVLKVTASSDIDISSDLVVPDTNQKSISELLDEKTQEETSAENIEKTSEEQK